MSGTDDERAYARMARTSWAHAREGARHLNERASEWARAEGIEAHLRESNARELSAQTARIERARARKGKRAQSAHTQVRAHAITAHEVKTRALATRAFRRAFTLAVPCALIAAPPWALINGDPGALILWPAAYGYLAWEGWTSKRERVAEATPTIELDTPKRNMFQRAQTVTTLPPTSEESAIIDRLRGWEDYAAERKLHEVVPGPPVIDESGLLLPMEFTGRWTKAQLDAQIDQVRALLAIPDEVRTQVKLGGTADRALIRIRTRVRELDLTWSPEREGLGLDADTAEVILIDITDRILVAGMSGAGKSVVLRVLMAWALSLPHTAIAIIDVKTEGALWSHTARVEFKPKDIESLVIELVEEMQEREDIMRSTGQDKWTPTEDRPRIVVVIDEGAEFMGWVPDAVDGIRTLAVRGRASEIVVWWATQKPTITGPGKGLDSMISGQFAYQICLAVTGPAEARNVLGENANANGWHPEHLDKGGWALIHDQGEDGELNPMRVWFMTKEDVKAIPERKAWHRAKPTKGREVPEALAVALHLSRDTNGVATTRLAEALNIRDTEVHARMREFGADPEPNAFAIGDGEKARGYRRSVLEDARQRWETTV